MVLRNSHACLLNLILHVICREDRGSHCTGGGGQVLTFCPTLEVSSYIGQMKTSPNIRQRCEILRKFWKIFKKFGKFSNKFGKSVKDFGKYETLS